MRIYKKLYNGDIKLLKKIKYKLFYYGRNFQFDAVIMKEYGIIPVLKTFSKKEIKEFRKFLLSPYHNTNKKVISLYDLLINNYPKFAKKFTYNELYLLLYKNNKYKRSSITNIHSSLFRLSLSFLEYEAIKNKYSIRSEFVSEELLKRKLFVLVKQRINSLEKKLSKEKLGTFHFYDLSQFYIAKVNYAITTENNNLKSYSVYTMESISKAGEYLICFFIAQIIQLYDDLEKMCRKYNKNVQSFPLGNVFSKYAIKETVGNILKNINLQNDHLFKIYMLLMQAFLDIHNHRKYLEFKNYLFVHCNKITKSEKQYLFGRLMDYCVIKSKISETSSKFFIEQVNIYSKILEGRYYTHSVSSHIPVQFFRNIIRAGIRAKRFKWTKNFINKYSSELSSHIRDSITRYSSAYVCFAERKFSEALEHISYVNVQYSIFKIDIRTLLIKIYYEKDFVESAISSIDSARHFIQANKEINLAHRNDFRNFIKLANKLIRLKNNIKKDALLCLKKEILDCKTVLEKDWLLEKINELGLKYKGAV